MRLPIFWLLLVICGFLFSSRFQLDIPIFLLVVILLIIYFFAWYFRPQSITFPTYLSQSQKAFLWLSPLFGCMIFFLWGTLIYSLTKTDCGSIYGIRDWIPVEEVKSGLLAQQKGKSAICGVQYYFCMSGKCPKLFTTVTLDISKQKEKDKVELKKIQVPEVGEPMQYLFFVGNSVKEKIYANLREYYGEEVGGLYISMLFGGEYVPKSIHERMKRAGLLHLVAVSGVNITVFLSIAAVLIKSFPRIFRWVCYFLLLLTFIAISGLSPPTVRAITSAFFLQILRTLGLRVSLKVSTPIVIVACLLLFPEYSESISFVLTCTAITTVVYICPLVTKFVNAKIKKEWLQAFLIKVGECFCIEIAINICLYWYFKEISLWGFITSLLADPIVDAFSLLGYISIPLVFVGGGLGRMVSVFPAMYCYLLVTTLRFW